jgi:hypothetical protein
LQNCVNLAAVFTFLHREVLDLLDCPEDQMKFENRRSFCAMLLAFLLIVPIAVRAEDLGDLSDNILNPNSIFNDIGPYGRLSPSSPRNPIGIYGSPISPYSATNPLAVDPPRLYDQEGNYRGKLSTNQLDPDSITNPLGRYGNPLSPDSINNPLGAGNPLDLGSPKNRFGSGWRIEGR